MFTFDEEMMIVCLESNGWTRGWTESWAVPEWTPSNQNADYASYSIFEAFSMLLKSKNLYGSQWQHGWNKPKERNEIFQQM